MRSRALVFVTFVLIAVPILSEAPRVHTKKAVKTARHAKAAPTVTTPLDGIEKDDRPF